jgi:biotin transport system substrate-specific component
VQDAAYRAPLVYILVPRQTVLRQALLVMGTAAFVALSAQVRFGLPFTPVPVTGQTFAVLLTGALLGSRLGAASLGSYWVMGACGLPFFNGWGGGWAIASGPTGGYVVGFIAAAFVVGWFAERGWDRGRWVIVPLLIGNALLYVPGLLWLARYVGPHAVWQAGLWPFLPGDLLKLVAAAVALPAGWTVVERFQPR